MLNFIKQHSTKFIIALLVLVIIFLSTKKNPFFKEVVKENKTLKEQNQTLQTEKEEIAKERNLYKDSVVILFQAGQQYEVKDTFILINIENNKQKTNEEINNVLSLSVDSNLKLFYKLTKLYTETRFLQDSLQ